MSENLEEEQKEELEELQNDVKPANKKVIIFNFGLIVVIFVGLFIYMMTVDGLDNIISLLQQVDYKWVIAGMVCLAIHWLCEAINLHIPIKKMYPKQQFTNSFKVSMIGLLFNNVTPFSSGGQPMQAYELTKTGKRVSNSLSAMAMKFIITQTALVISTVVVVAFEFSFFASLMQDYLWIAIIGFTLNILAIVVVILAGVKKKLITFFTTPVIKFLGKIHIFKHPEVTIENLDKSIDNFRQQFLYMKSEKAMVCKMFIVAVIQTFAYYSITYMVYRAFGNSGISFWQIIPAQAFLLLIMTFIPTPGSGLGAERWFLFIIQFYFQIWNYQHVNFILAIIYVLFTYYRRSFFLNTNERKEEKINENLNCCWWRYQ